jgi:DUF1365 family protein
MPINSTSRRHRRANRLLAISFSVIRIYFYYLRKKKLCVISSESESCSEYYRFKRRCSLVPNDSELDKQLKIKEKLNKEIVEAMRVAVEADAKAICLRK